MSKGWLNYAMYVVMAGGLLLLPLVPFFVWPGSALNLELVKQVFFFVFLTICLVLVLAQIWRDKKIVIPQSYLWLSAVAIIVVSKLSALISGSYFHSILGTNGEVDSVIFITAGLILCYLVSRVFDSRPRLVNFYLGLSLVGGAVCLWQIGWFILVALTAHTPLHLISASLLNGAFNLIGKWNSWAWFLGLVLYVTILLLDLFSWREIPKLRSVLWLVVLVSALGVVLANFYVIWLIIAILALLSLILVTAGGYSSGGNKIWRPLMWLTLLTALLTLISFTVPALSRQLTAIQDHLGIATIEVRPSWLSTWSVATAEFKANPLLGSGPAQFSLAWAKFKPLAVNLDSQFWSFDFSNGISWLATLLVTVGVLGVVAWLAWLINLALVAWRSLRHRDGDSTRRNLALLAWGPALYLWLALAFYNPDAVLLIMTLALTGLALAASRSVMSEKVWVFDWQNARTKTIGWIVNLALFIIVIATLVGALGRLAGAWTFDQAVVAAAAGNLAEAKTLTTRALIFDHNDLYERSLVTINLAGLQQVVTANGNNPKPSAETQAALQAAWNGAVAAGQAAIKLNPKNYQNYLALGQVYEAGVTLGVNQSYQAAKNMYQQALVLNPTNPLLPLYLGRLEIAANNQAAGEQALNQALNLKPNYLDALFLLAQLDARAGKLADAIDRAQQAVKVAPTDPNAYFQLGVLEYSAKQYSAAAQDLQKAIDLTPGQANANAQYFLGLSYNGLNDRDRALAQFTNLLKTNPGNQELQKLVKSLTGSAGKATTSKP